MYEYSRPSILEHSANSNQVSRVAEFRRFGTFPLIAFQQNLYSPARIPMCNMLNHTCSLWHENQKVKTVSLWGAVSTVWLTFLSSTLSLGSGGCVW